MWQLNTTCPRPLAASGVCEPVSRGPLELSAVRPRWGGRTGVDWVLSEGHAGADRGTWGLTMARRESVKAAVSLFPTIV